MRSIRIHGMGNHQYDNVRVGINGRLDTLQAAVLLAKFAIFPEEVALRIAAAKRYDDLLDPGAGLQLPRVPQNTQSAWAQYSVLAGDEAHREAVRNRLHQEKIPTAVYYPKPLHLQEVFAPLAYREGDFPVSEACARRIFSLPMHPYLKERDQGRIASILNQEGFEGPHDKR